jgi:hypothetical protein
MQECDKERREALSTSCEGGMSHVMFLQQREWFSGRCLRLWRRA